MTTIKINGVQKSLQPPITGTELYNLAKEVVGHTPYKVHVKEDPKIVIPNDDNPIVVISGQEFMA